MSARLDLWSASAATDAAWTAAADVATLAERHGLTYRLVGGLAVTLLTHVHDVADQVPARETADADMGVPRQVLADVDMVDALRALDYEQEAGNRFRRDADGRRAVIDVLTVSDRDADVYQETIGGMAVDAIPGMHVAMMLAPTRIDVRAHLRTGTGLEMTLDVMDVRAGLVMKAYAHRGQLATNDAIDVWRLLEATDAAGHSAADWPTHAGAREAAAHLRRFFGTPPARGAAEATRDAAARARIRLLTLKQARAAVTA